MNDLMVTSNTIRLLVPELLVVALATFIYVGGAFMPGRWQWNFTAFLGLLLTGYSLYTQDRSLGQFDPAYSGPLLVDYFGHALRWFVVGAGLLFVLTSFRAASDELVPEYLGSLLLLIAGLMIVCSAGDLVLLFVGLELISIPTYILLYLGRRDAGSQEATVKYFFLSILSSALLLYGFSFLYGMGGSTRLLDIRGAIAAIDPARQSFASLLPVALVLIVAGLGFRMAAAPFHFYAPDVYQGTTSGNAGLLSVAPKIAGVVALVRLLLFAMPGLEPYAWKLILAVAVVTMTLGNVMALWQRNVRRLMAYSSIAHAGYLLIGLTVALAVAGGARIASGFDGTAAMLFYLLAYGLATIGAFAALAYLGREERDVDSIDELAGLGKSYPVVALALAVFMFSLTGIPVLVGFWGKLTLLLSALSVDAGAAPGATRNWFIALAVAGAINAAISAGYYLRVVSVMYFRDGAVAPRGEGGGGAWLAAVVSALLLLAVSLSPGSMLDVARRASQSVSSEHRLLDEASGENAALPGQGAESPDSIDRVSAAHAATAGR